MNDILLILFILIFAFYGSLSLLDNLINNKSLFKKNKGKTRTKI